jgi:predicted amidohydrolase YtcJ
MPLASIANSNALRLAGITRETLPPCASVQIEKDFATGEPTGVFLEWTMMPIVELSLMGVAPRFVHEQRIRGLRDSMRIYNAFGTTSVFEGHGIAAEVLTAYREVRDRGEMTVRAHLVHSPAWNSSRTVLLPQLLDGWGGWLAGRGLGDPFLRVSGLYTEVGPSLEDQVRSQAAPYTGWAGFCYDAGLPRERVKELLIEAARRDIRMTSLHADLLDLYEDVNRVVPIAGQRWVIGHISVLDSDAVKRIRDLGLVLTTHTNRFLFKEGEILRARVGEAAEATIVPLRTLRQAGVHVALATDNVPASLFYPIWQCVARADRYSGRVIAPDQRLSREDALRAATIEGAYLMFEEHLKGSIEVGKLADLVILSDDPLSVEEARLKDIVAELTVVGGRIVFERENAVGARKSN